MVVRLTSMGYLSLLYLPWFIQKLQDVRPTAVGIITAKNLYLFDFCSNILGKLAQDVDGRYDGSSFVLPLNKEGDTEFLAFSIRSFDEGLESSGQLFFHLFPDVPVVAVAVGEGYLVYQEEFQSLVGRDRLFLHAYRYVYCCFHSVSCVLSPLGFGLMYMFNFIELASIARNDKNVHSLNIILTIEYKFDIITL